MLANVRHWTKTHPQVYDTLKAVKRMVSPRTDPVYAVLDAFSQAMDRTVRFIQIGANDGLRNDPVREFVVRDHWQGVLVEPLPHIFELLVKNYAPSRFSGLHFVNAAVSSAPGEALGFWTFRKDVLAAFDKETQLEFLRKASFDRAHVERFLHNAPFGAEALEEIKVPCVTVQYLIERYFNPPAYDLLVIDAEGHEDAILGSIDFAKAAPHAVFFESHHLGAKRAPIVERLKAADYEVHQLVGDTFAVRRSLAFPERIWG